MSDREIARTLGVSARTANKVRKGGVVTAPIRAEGVADRPNSNSGLGGWCRPSPRRILLVPDTHSPFHDPRAWAAMMDYARDFKPDTIVHLGDLADCYSVSDHERDPRRAHNLAEECGVTNSLLDDLDGLKAETRIFCVGNHEYRLKRYMMRSAPALLGAVSIEQMLHLRDRGWDIVPYMQHKRVGNLHVTHEAGVCGTGAVRQMATRFGHNIVFGHTHRLESIYFGTVTGDRYVAASLGWLGDIEEASYLSAIEKAAWQHGFGTAVMEASGDFRLDLVPIVGGRVIK